MRIFLILTIIPLIISCQEKIDLSRLVLNEQIENVINFNDSIYIGVETVEYPYALLIEVEESTTYKFDEIDLKNQKVYFQISSVLLKTDSITKRGGGHINLQQFSNKIQLDSILEEFNAESNIYGVRIEIKTESLQKSILKKLTSKYGKGIKNRNTDNGLYWNVKDKNKYIFYSPDYDRLIILNSTKLSKNCYWDSMNGLIDFGGCNNEKYTEELLKNTPKIENNDKPTVEIGNNWNINNLTLDQSNEKDFLKTVSCENFERAIAIGNKEDLSELIYINDYNSLYFYFTLKGNGTNNEKNEILKGYSIMDFERVNISFAHKDLKKGIKFEDAIKLFDKNEIINYDELKFSNFIELKKGDKKISLIFKEYKGFSSMYVK